MAILLKTASVRVSSIQIMQVRVQNKGKSVWKSRYDGDVSVTLPGEGRLLELGLSWEHYLAAPAPPDEIIGGVLCDTRADVVIKIFG